jgi:hypothetical protein
MCVQPAEPPIKKELLAFANGLFFGIAVKKYVSFL